MENNIVFWCSIIVFILVVVWAFFMLRAYNKIRKK